uniref:Putative ovule protein n=1 Tax=Solanum chacoense TaxID=4108 RepID=A0A0V0GRX1_SOLCH
MKRQKHKKKSPKNDVESIDDSVDKTKIFKLDCSPTMNFVLKVTLHVCIAISLVTSDHSHHYKYDSTLHLTFPFKT